MNKQVQSLIGIAYISKNISFGDDVVTMLQKSKSKLILVSDQASENTKNKYFQKAYFYNIPCYIIDDLILNHGLGKKNIKVISINNQAFAAKIIKMKGGKDNGN